MLQSRHSSAPLPTYGAGRPAGDGAQVRPGSGWRDLLLDQGAFSWLLHALLPALSGEGALRQPLAGPSRQLLVCPGMLSLTTAL